MKGTGLRLVAVVVFLLVFAGANMGAFLLGRASVEYKVSWEDTQVFYAEILERRENSFLVEGLSVNDVNHQGQFSFSTKGVPLWWHGVSLSFADLKPGHTLKIIYDKTAQEPGSTVLAHVLYVGGMDHEL